MKCLVTTKQVIDPFVAIRVDKGSNKVANTNVKMAMNPFDEIAMEQARELKDQSIITEIVAVTIGNLTATEILRQALARGADRAILIESESLETLSIAKILHQVVLQENIELVLMGKQAIDNDCNQVGQMLAGLLGWGQATFASKIVIQTNSLQVSREVDDGIEVIQVKLPAVVTVDLRLNEPRYISLPELIAAKSKPIKVKQVADYKIDLKQNLQLVQMSEPVKRAKGTIVSTAKELVAKLTDEAKVL